MSSAPSRPSASLDGSAHRTVATSSSCADAERAVDLLTDPGFAVEQVTVVGTGSRHIERAAEQLRGRPPATAC